MIAVLTLDAVGSETAVFVDATGLLADAVADATAAKDSGLDDSIPEDAGDEFSDAGGSAGSLAIIRR